MKLFISAILFFLLFIPVLQAEDQSYDLHMKMIITSPDTSIRTLNHTGKSDEIIEGYFLLPRYKDMDLELPIRAFLQPGGFNFLDQKVFSGMGDFLGEKWAENKFPVTDLEMMTNGMDISKIISFQIKPVLLNMESDSITLFIKYAVFNLIEQKNYDLDYEYNLKLFYKKAEILFDEKSSFDFINEHFAGHTISFLFTKSSEQKRSLTVENSRNIIEEIVKSANESTLQDLNFNMGAELYRDKYPGSIAPAANNYLALYSEYHLPDYNVIVNTATAEVFNLPVSIYKAELSFPFLLYNSQKNELYKNYLTREDLFQSTCDVIIVPVSMNADTLTADIFVSYKKLNLDDDFPRWSPIKKRLSINSLFGTTFELPKENWSASFTREGESYDIFGYSDFERYVSEWLIIKLFKM